MTNPNDAIGTNAAYGGRTSTDAFNDGLAFYARGIVSGWDCVPDSGMTVNLGGSSYVRDVAIAQDNAGNKTTINNISRTEVAVTISPAPASNTRIDAIVAYVDNPATGNSSEADNPDACGLIAVDGTPSASPVAPNESAIRSAITADGASGSTAYYVVLAYITVATGTTDIVASYIQKGQKALSSFVDFVYPIGSYYETTDSLFDPNITWGGTWVEDSAGRVLVSQDNGTFSTIGDTGGEEEHTLILDEIPSHHHEVSRYTNTEGFSIAYANPVSGWCLRTNLNAGQNDIITTNKGGSKAHNNLQPYVVVKRWHRTA